MSRLGIDRIAGLIYGCRDVARHPVWTKPVVSKETLIRKPRYLVKIQHNGNSDRFALIFVKTSFDLVNGNRRGRSYKNHRGIGA